MAAFPSSVLCLSLLLSLFLQPSHCQQAYLNLAGLNCSTTPAISKGYLCDGHIRSCNSFVTFRPLAPYDTALSIAHLLGSEVSEVSSLNNISSTNDKIPTNKLIVVPIPCDCPGNIFQHFTIYTARNDTTYFITANDTFQGLTTCQALMGQNYYDPENIPVGTDLVVPVRCACPSENQTASGVISLLTYVANFGDTITSIGKMFGVNTSSILEANLLSQDSIIYPFAPLLIPLKSESCSAYPRMFFCNCPNDHLANGTSGLNCMVSDDGKSFPAKLVTLLGMISLYSPRLFLFQWSKPYDPFNSILE